MKSKKLKKPDNAPLNPFAKVEGIERFAAQWKYRVAIVKLAKKNGLPGFDAHGRVDPLRAIPAINEMMASENELPEGVTSPQDWLATEKAKREAIKRKVDEKSVMPSGEAVRQSGQAMGYTFAELERRDRELPPVLAGLSAVEIFKKMSADTEAIRKTLKTKFESIGC